MTNFSLRPRHWTTVLLLSLCIITPTYAQNGVSSNSDLRLIAAKVIQAGQATAQIKQDTHDLDDLLGKREWNFASDAKTRRLSIIGTYGGMKDDQTVLIQEGFEQPTEIPIDWLTPRAQSTIKKIAAVESRIRNAASLLPTTTTTATADSEGAKRDQVIMLRNVSVSQQGKTFQFTKDQVLDVEQRKDNFAWLLDPQTGQTVQLDDRMFRPYIEPPADGLPAPSLGIDVQPTSRVRMRGIPLGLRVRQVFPNGLGDRMGLRRLDIILAVNGQRITTLDEYHRAAPLRGDGNVILTIHRLGRKLTLDSRILLYELPPHYPGGDQWHTLSIQGVIDHTTGLFRVTFVGQGAGKQMGLAKDFSIFKINDVEIRDANDIDKIERLSQGRFKIEGEDQFGNPFMLRNYHQ